ncbi:MAG: DUF378 domain-containing protein [Candidatus Atribacteria bacterium]|nr:DUF378 domain-containing protein [Candidatus Atribacteria bacterium]
MTIKTILWKVLKGIAVVLVIIGGINWGLIGLFSFDVIAAIFGVMTILSRIIYILIGLSSIFLIREYFSGKSKKQL